MCISIHSQLQQYTQSVTPSLLHKYTQSVTPLCSIRHSQLLTTAVVHNKMLPYTNFSLSRTVDSCHKCLAVYTPFNDTKAYRTQTAEHHKYQELIVQSHNTRVEEASGCTERLRELEQSKSRARVVRVHGAEYGVDLSVEAGVTKAEQKTAHHCYHFTKEQEWEASVC